MVLEGLDGGCGEGPFVPGDCSFEEICEEADLASKKRTSAFQWDENEQLQIKFVRVIGFLMDSVYVM